MQSTAIACSEPYNTRASDKMHSYEYYRNAYRGIGAEKGVLYTLYRNARITAMMGFSSTLNKNHARIEQQLN